MTATLEREEIAKIVYDAMPYRPVKHEPKPEWVPGGNSLMQDEARRAADAILSLAQAKASEGPITTEQLDILQFGRVLHDRPTPSVQEQPVAWDIRVQFPECAGAEPSLRSMVFSYYHLGLGDAKKAKFFADRFIKHVDSATPSQTARERERAVAECLAAARKAFEDSMNEFILIGPSGMARKMLNSIAALSPTGENP